MSYNNLAYRMGMAVLALYKPPSDTAQGRLGTVDFHTSEQWIFDIIHCCFRFPDMIAKVIVHDWGLRDGKRLI